MIGIDLVFIPEFKKKLETSDLNTIFLDSELRENQQIESLAAIFAAKEAFFKALGRKESWLDVWVEKEPSGKPNLKSRLLPSVKPELSVSHSGEYATAIVIIPSS